MGVWVRFFGGAIAYFPDATEGREIDSDSDPELDDVEEYVDIVDEHGAELGRYPAEVVHEFVSDEDESFDPHNWPRDATPYLQDR